MKAGALRGNGFYGVLCYAFGDNKDAEIVAGNMAGTTPKQLSAEFGVARRKRPSITKPVSHSWLRLPDNENISAEKFSAIANAYMQDMGFSNSHQWVAVSHNDTSGQHIHIIASRIGLDGQLWNGRWEYFSAMRVATGLEKKFGLTITKAYDEAPNNRKQPTKNEIEKALRDGRAPIRQQLQQIIDEALNEPQSVFAFIERLKASSVVAIPNVASTGRLNGMAFQLEGITFKGSQLGKGYSLKKLQEKGVSYDQTTEGGAFIRYTNKIKKAFSQDGSGDAKNPSKHLAEYQSAGHQNDREKPTRATTAEVFEFEAQQITKSQLATPTTADSEVRVNELEEHSVDHNFCTRAGYRRWHSLDELFSNQGGVVSSMSYQHKQKELRKQISALQADKYALLVSKENSLKVPKRYLYAGKQLEESLPRLMQLSNNGYVLQVQPVRENYYQLIISDMNRRQKERLEEKGYTPNLIQQVAPNSYEVIFSIPLYDLDVSQEYLDSFANDFAKRFGGEAEHSYHLSGFRHYGSFLTKILHFTLCSCEKALTRIKQGLIKEPESKPVMTINQKLYNELKNRKRENDYSVEFGS